MKENFRKYTGKLEKLYGKIQQWYYPSSKKKKLIVKYIFVSFIFFFFLSWARQPSAIVGVTIVRVSIVGW